MATNTDGASKAVPTYPKPVREQTRLDREITIRWGKERPTRESFEAALEETAADASSRQPTHGCGLRACERQQTNLVIKTREEAASLYYHLQHFLRPAGRPAPPDETGTQAYQRVTARLTAALRQQGLTLEDTPHRPSVIEREQEPDD